MKHSISRDLYAYWDGLRVGRTAPERADIDPAAIRHVLAYTFVLEIADGRRSARPRDVTFRLSGTRLNALFGRDLKGCGFDRIWRPEARPMAEALLDGVLDDRAGVVASARGGPIDRAAVDIELLLLPLRHHGHTHSRIFGSMVAHEAPGWMGLTAAAPLDLCGFRTLIDGIAETPGRPAAPRRAPGRAAGDIPPDLAATALVSRRIGRFRVYDGGAVT